jgi:hypothetical protein
VTFSALSLPPLLILPSDLNAASGVPTSPASPDVRAKRTNPLVDLIDSEKLYVDQLTGVIRVGDPSRHLIEAVSCASAHG